MRLVPLNKQKPQRLGLVEREISMGKRDRAAFITKRLKRRVLYICARQKQQRLVLVEKEISIRKRDLAAVKTLRPKRPVSYVSRSLRRPKDTAFGFGREGNQ